MTKSNPHFLAVFFILILSLGTSAQKHSCCQMPAADKFVAMVQQKDFIDAHASPQPFHYETVNGQNITFKTADGQEGRGFEIQSGKPTNNYLLIFHEWWGLNDYIKQEAEKFQRELGNVNVIAIDMFDGKVATDAKEASALVQGLKDERAQAIIAGAIQYAGSKARIATLGWCFGGGMSLQASIAAGTQGVGCVMYYGMPENNLEKLKKLHAPVLGIFGTQDKFINPELVKEFEKNMNALHKKLDVKNYNADHAFANPSNPHHNPEATADAHKHALAFLRETIGK